MKLLPGVYAKFGMLVVGPAIIRPRRRLLLNVQLRNHFLTVWLWGFRYQPVEAGWPHPRRVRLIELAFIAATKNAAPPDYRMSWA